MILLNSGDTSHAMGQALRTMARGSSLFVRGVELFLLPEHYVAGGVTLSNEIRLQNGGGRGEQGGKH
jgi:hypothetical protein